MRHEKRDDRTAFFNALRMWDRPEGELFGKPLAADVETDKLIDELFSIPGRGLVE